MALNSKEEIRQFLILQEKSTQDLMLLCEGMGLNTIGVRDELIWRLMSLGLSPQLNWKTPQLVALRARFNSQRIPGAHTFLERIRKTIDKENNTKEFSIITSKGDSYFQKLRFIPTDESMMQFLLENNMLYPLESQRDLNFKIRRNPEEFLFNLVNRTYLDKQFIMLHCQIKE